MIKENICGKKLLLLGGIGPAYDLLTLAHRNHVFLGVADYNKDTVFKKMADAAHDINILDVDSVVDLYYKEHYDGIISNFNDMLLPYVTEVAERVNAYVPYTKEQVKMSTDKKYFKDMCLKYGVSVPIEYEIKNKEDIINTDIKYPVIIKPVDMSGSKGIVVCRNQQELWDSYDVAMDTSRCKEILVEEYIEYDDEINVTYIIQNGKIQLAAIHDRYFNTIQKGAMRVPDLYVYPSKYTKLFKKQYDKPIVKMLRGIGLQNGSMFMQGCVKNDKVYLYEAGMRLNGCKTYQILEAENKYNTFERLMNLALTGSMGEYQHFDPEFRHWYATWNVVARPGAIIEKIQGCRELESYPWMIQNAICYYEGEKIPENSTGTLIQLQSRMHIMGDTSVELIGNLQKAYDLYHLRDKNGNEIILPPHDLEHLKTQLLYSL